MKNRQGFTVSEFMIALGLVSILIALAMPATLGNLPNRNLIKFHKALNSFQNAIQAVLMDANETQEFTDKVQIPLTKADFDEMTTSSKGVCYKKYVCLTYDDEGNCEEYDNNVKPKTVEKDESAQCFTEKNEPRYKEEAINSKYTEGMKYPLVKKGTWTPDDEDTEADRTITESMLCDYIAGKMNIKQNNCASREFTAYDNVKYKFGKWNTIKDDAGNKIPTKLSIEIYIRPNDTAKLPSTEECNTKIKASTNTFTLELTPQGKIINSCAAATKTINE